MVFYNYFESRWVLAVVNYATPAIGAMASIREVINKVIIMKAIILTQFLMHINLIYSIVN